MTMSFNDYRRRFINGTTSAHMSRHCHRVKQLITCIEEGKYYRRGPEQNDGLDASDAFDKKNA